MRDTFGKHTSSPAIGRRGFAIGGPVHLHRLRRLALAAAALLAMPGAAQPVAAPPAPDAPASAAAQTVHAAGAPASSPGDDEAALRERFSKWVAAFRTTALAAGIRENTFDAAFDGVQVLPRVIERDRTQPEFVRAVWDYLESAASAARVTRGQEKLAQARAEAEAAAARHGVPAPVLAAIWGLESNYGDNVGSTPTIDALATLAFDGRREAWARGQLLAALRILQGGDIERARMVGSWAGAMGQTQFLPSSFLAYAVDGDGDGRRDIWGSVADVLASTAHYLARVGWRAGEPWGLEVTLPERFDLNRADLQVRQPSAQWAIEGVRAADGTDLPALAESALLLPAGARGPAFLVGTNFRALLRYNSSTSYALAVGLLAQRLAGGPGVAASWPRDLAPLSRAQLIALQTALNARGFESGAPDGLAGPATREALRRYQRSAGLPPDGFPTLELLQRMQAP